MAITGVPVGEPIWRDLGDGRPPTQVGADDWPGGLHNVPAMESRHPDWSLVD